MPTLAPILEDPRFAELDRVGKAKAREQLFGAWLEADEERREVFVASPEEQQNRIFGEFVQRVTKRYPQQFATEIEGPPRAPSADRTTYSDPGNPVAVPAAAAEPVPTKIPVPILDSASEAKIAQVVEGARTGQAPDWDAWSVEDFSRLGPYLDLLAPGHSARSVAQEKARAEAKALKVKPETRADTIIREVGEGVFSPVVQAGDLLAAKLGEDERTTKIRQVQEVNSWVLGDAGGLETAGAVGGLVAGGVGVARGLASKAQGLKFFTRRNLAKLAAADAALGAAYAERAPGYLAHKVEEWSGEQDKARTAVLTALEAAGISGLTTTAMRTSSLKRFARENLGWTGRSWSELKEFVESEALRRARPAEAAGPPGRGKGEEVRGKVEAPVVRAPEAPLPSRPVRPPAAEPDAVAAAGPEAFGRTAARTQGPALPAAEPGEVPSFGFAVEEPENAFTTWGKDVVVPLARLEHVRIVETPELVRIVRELTGSAPKVRKLPKSLGVFSTKAGKIKLDPKIFRNPAVAARVLGHELFHLADWLPDKTLARGNLLGRLATLREFMSTTLDMAPVDPSRMITPQDRGTFRKQAYQETKQKLGPRPLREKFPDQFQEWTEAMNARYRERVAEEIGTRRLATADEVREELVGVSDFWRPFLDQAAAGTVPERYVAYRSSATELYADFGSVLMNDPAALKARAPKAWAMFWNYLDRKPEVKRTLFEVQELLESGADAKLARRRADILTGFAQGEAVFVRKMEERRAAGRSFRGWHNRVRQELENVFAPVEQRARQIAKQPGGAPAAKALEWLLDEHPLAMEARNYQLLQDLYERVVKPIYAAGLSLDDVGELLLLRRITGTQVPEAAGPATAPAELRRGSSFGEEGGGQRAAGGPEGTRRDLANPWGHTPQSAAEQLAYLEQLHGPENWARIQAAAQAFDEVAWPIVEEAVALGSYSRETFETVIAPNRGTYATFAVVEHMQDYVPAGIIRQQGTLSAVANPFLSTTLKLASLNKLNQLQKVKRGVAGFMQQFFPEEITPAERVWSGKGYVVRPSKERGQGTLELLEDGQRAGFYVPEEVEKMFDGITPARASAIVEVLNFGFRRLFYPLFITYNPVFQLAMSPVRDIRRTIRNIGFRNGLRQVGQYVANMGTLSVEAVNAPLRAVGLPPFPVPATETARQVRAYLQSQPNDLIREMMASSAISSPIDTFTTGGVGPESFEQLLRRFQVLPDKDKPMFLRARFLNPVWATLRGIEYAGLTMEFLPKVGTYKYLTAKNSVNPKEIAATVRNNVGVPNFRRSGRHTRIAGTVFPFFNVFIQGIRDDARLASGARTRAGWWFRWAAGSGMWRMLQAAGAAGLLGTTIKELYDYASDYDKTNYGVIPLGWADGGDFGKRLVMLRIPEDETDRLLGGIMHKAVQGLAGEGGGGQWQQLLGFAGGQVPGINPAVEIPVAWGTWLAGRNPIDGFRGQPVLSNTEFLAGGWPALQGMSTWTLEQTGLTNFVRWDPKAETWMETTLSATPGVNRLLKVSDYGAREQQRGLEQAEDVVRAKLRTSLPESVQNLHGEYQFLRSIKETNKTPAQLARWQVLSSWYNRIYKPMEEQMLLLNEAGVSTKPLREQLGTVSEAFER